MRWKGKDEAEEVRRRFVEETEGFQRKHTDAMMDYLEWDLDSDAE